LAKLPFPEFKDQERWVTAFSLHSHPSFAGFVTPLESKIDYCGTCSQFTIHGSLSEAFDHLSQSHETLMTSFGLFDPKTGITALKGDSPVPVIRMSVLETFLEYHVLSTIISKCVIIAKQQLQYTLRIRYGLVDMEHHISPSFRMQDDLIRFLRDHFHFLVLIDYRVYSSGRSILNSSSESPKDRIRKDWELSKDLERFKIDGKNFKAWEGGRIAVKRLSCAEENLVLDTKFFRSENLNISTSLDPHSVLLWLINELLTRPVLNQWDTPALYRKLFGLLRSKTYNNPRKRWIHTIHGFDEEIKALQEITKWQESCVQSLKYVLDPCLWQKLNIGERRDFNFKVFDQKFLNQRLLQNIKDNKEDFGLLAKSCDPLVERIKLVSEINEEDHGKVCEHCLIPESRSFANTL
jgi:hypothetical protein